MKKPGITASVKSYIKDKKDIFQVVACDILLSEFNWLTDTFSKNNEGRVFIVGRKGTISDLTKINDIRPGMKDGQLTAIESKISSRPILAAVENWIEDGMKEKQAFRFKDKETYWWGGITCSDTDNGKITVGVIMKEEMLASQLDNQGFLFVFIVSIILAGGAVIITLYAFRYLRQLETISVKTKYSSASKENLRSLIDSGESEILEFKSTLRWNLKSGKPGKEIELACLKTLAGFMNSEGGTLLVGVEDNGQIMGIGADNFQNEDKYLLHFNNIFKQYIGLEFSPHIAFDLKSMDGKRILVVDCDRSDDPVFLKDKNNEDFYIRIGLGSRKLPTREVLEYLKKRE